MSTVPESTAIAPERTEAPWRITLRRLHGHRSVRLGLGVLLAFVLMAALAPWLYTIDPNAMDPLNANMPVGAHVVFTDLAGVEQQRWLLFGTDSMGRDIYSRVVYGARVSLAVGLAVMVVSLLVGSAVGLIAGYFRRMDGPLMRFMDGLMAIPGILLAIALVALWQASLLTLVVAIAIPDIPRVARLARSSVLSVREQAFVEAAIMMQTPSWKIVMRHIFPNALAPLIVQATFTFGAAILVEAVLSFLGVGFSPDVPTWGNIMAEGRVNFLEVPSVVLIPGAFLALTVLGVNMLGDGLRDVLDPRSIFRGGR